MRAAPGLSSNWTKSTKRAGREESPDNDKDLMMRKETILWRAHMVGRRPENDCGEEDEYISRQLREEETEQQD